MKIMIVEDEPLLRQGLISKIDWRASDVRLVAEAGNGIEALEQLSRCEPDVVLTDVRMPGMDGLQLIGEARRAYPHLKFVIISGFNEFDYVREAMRNQVKDYLLKPVDARKLQDLLAELGQEVRQEREASARLGELEEWTRLAGESDAKATDHLLTQRILAPDSSWSRLPAHLLGRSFYAAAALRLADTAPGPRFGEDALPLARFAVQNVLQHAFAPFAGDALVFKHAYDADEIVTFLGFDDSASYEAAVVRLDEALRWIGERLEIEASVGIGGAGARISHLRDSYGQAKEALLDRLLRGEGRVYVHEEAVVSGDESGPSPLGEEAERTLQLLLEEDQPDDFAEQALAVFRAIAARPGARFRQLADAYAETWRLIRRQAARLGTALPAAAYGDRSGELARMRHWSETEGPLRAALRSLRPTAPDREDDCSGDRVVAAVKQYADGHYAEDLSLQWVADAYFIHPNYFAKRFKQLVGVSFGGYVTGLRIERSKALLLTTALKISRIARLVGYEDQNYFCNVFKKRTGMSPSAYRGESAAQDDL
ncbi:response regulator [Cohnella sp. REN36]|uniref:response regulator n=1 Tax=Cohnella sp. REN36 TaxID=2887347 RepID=UPI001D142AAA|nr:response regulator [Cohnella sp. REN36]MCC3376540.1 response regulator [Cohnella sp. REN36]